MIRNKTLIRLVNRLGWFFARLSVWLEDTQWQHLHYCETCGQHTWEKGCVKQDMWKVHNGTLKRATDERY